MSRVKRGKIHTKHRKNLLKKTKGYRFGRSKKFAQATEAFLHAGTHAFRDRKRKKRDYRALWQIKINAAVREHGLSYSKFISALKKAGIDLNRKALADLAENKPKAFENIFKKLKTPAK